MVPLVAPMSTHSSIPVYYSGVYVHRDSKFNCITDLNGASFAYNDEASLSGFHCIKFFLKALQASDQSISFPFFSEIRRTGAHKNSLKFLIDKIADVVVLDCKVVESLLQTSTGRDMMEQCRLISVPSMTMQLLNGEELQQCCVSMDGLLGPNPAQPIVASKRLPPSEIIRLKQALLSVSSEALAPLKAVKFVEVSEEYYTNIGLMMQSCSSIELLSPRSRIIPGFLEEPIDEDPYSCRYSAAK